MRHGRIAGRERAGSAPQPHKEYRIGRHTILLPSGHLLPGYQAQHRLYDRFLPILCKELDDPERWIIDVGANAGDTAAAAAQACRNPLLCVEGDSQFFDLLQKNISILARESHVVRCVQAIAGTGRYAGALESDGTTAHLAKAKGAELRAASLDDILRAADVPAAAIALLKVDTDGYDADVIFSAEDILAASKPVLFWENYFAAPAQRQDLEALYQSLAGKGYEHFWVFDNFGNLMLRECSARDLISLNGYVASQQFHGCTRTIYYTDILAAPPHQLAQARKAVSIFISSFIERE
ncbi:MAG TPA: FkbM family methyltransferase [Methylocella sp.]|nr:FkbM family methyltransferase [Methylocella sp.]